MSVSDLDHPLVFVIVMTLVVATTAYVLGWAFTAAGLHGPAKLMSGYQP